MREGGPYSYPWRVAYLTELGLNWHYGLVNGFDGRSAYGEKVSVPPIEFNRGYWAGKELHKWVEANVPDHNCKRDDEYAK